MKYNLGIKAMRYEIEKVENGFIIMNSRSVEFGGSTMILPRKIWVAKDVDALCDVIKSIAGDKDVEISAART